MLNTYGRQSSKNISEKTKYYTPSAPIRLSKSKPPPAHSIKFGIDDGIMMDNCLSRTIKSNAISPICCEIS